MKKLARDKTLSATAKYFLRRADKTAKEFGGSPSDVTERAYLKAWSQLEDFVARLENP